MTFEASSRLPRVAIGLLLLVGLSVLLQVGLLISRVLANTGGGAAATAVVADAVSDQVAATAAQFRVDESGAATYSVALYALPGTAGVSPKLSLNYSSQGGYGPLGKGWSIGGLSSITRCRATREAGDFIVSGTPSDGNPAPINYTASDRYCLDGQRLVPAQSSGAACPAISGMVAQNLRTEIESFQRVCAYTPSSGATGPAFFTVDRKDGSRSWYGDRDNDTAANRPDGYFNSTAPGKTGFALVWAQTRFQDSNGNYINYLYYENADSVVGEQLIKEIQYTGKTVLPGQTGTALAPFARIGFAYSLRAAANRSIGYSSGGVLTQAHRLDSITTCAGGAPPCTADLQARRYNLAYARSSSGSGLDTLISLQECKDSDGAACLPATTFNWGTAKFEFATREYPPNLPTGSASKFEGFKMGDVDGDGRQDIVYLKDGSDSDPCPTETFYVLFATTDAAGNPSYQQGYGICSPTELMPARGEGGWNLLDYNGDGRDDLFVSTPDGMGWRIYPSQGRSGTYNFDTSRNLLAALSPVIPSYPSPNDQPQLADLNGDGLIDVVYPTNAGLRARLMERQGATYGWGTERQVQLGKGTLPLITDQRCSQSDYVCEQWLAGTPSNKTGFMQLADFNGDGSSDLLMSVVTNILYTGNCGPIPLRPGTSRDASRYQFQQARARAPTPALTRCPPEINKDELYALTVQSVTPTVITIGAYAYIGRQPQAVNLVDINGDGLTDIFYRPAGVIDWSYRINTGTGLGAEVQLPLRDFQDQVRFADVNGDGRTDVLHAYNGGNYKAYNVLYAQPAGGFGPEMNLPGGNAVLCEGYKCDNRLKVPIFADLDGDGNVDFVSIKTGDNNADLLLSRASQRFVPRDVIIRISNGLGAQTNLAYAPLTDAQVYRRDSGTRNAVNWGRGSAVQDFLAPSYVVWRASSSSPQSTNWGAAANLYYRYAGAKVQAGGRGFLGFREIVTTDINQTGGYVTTQTTYSQNFPFIGMPLKTVKVAMIGAVFQPPSCPSVRPTEGCFAAPGAGFPALATTGWFSSNNQAWESDTDIGAANVNYAPGVQAPIQIRTAGTDENLRDPYNGVQTSRIVTTFDYGAYGNVSATTADTYTGASTLTSTLITANSYSDNVAAWRLGRVSGTTVTHRRPGRADVVRVATFAYSMTGPITGQLLAERSQTNGSADQDLRKDYAYDDFGNRTSTRTCANPSTGCTGNIAFHPTSPTVIQRYSRTVYDARGRFPVATYEPFWNGAGTVEKITQTVVARNLFGDVVQAYDVNGRGSLAVAGALGRPYYTWTETVPGSAPGAAGGGVESLTTYRWCGTGTNQVSCPAGAKFRQKVAADGAPTAWTYFDILGRSILQVAESFNAGIGGKDASAVCTTYDATGKPKQVSNPFFIAGLAGADPGGLTAVCSTGRVWSTTTYDVLGRPTDVTAADASVTSTDYVGNQTLLTDARGNLTTQTRNGLGELTQVVDANGLAMTYSYLADGSTFLVSRNAGRGVIQNQFFFDALGRKVQQIDPDSGTTYFSYNALGELTAQQDAAGNRIENEIDARGRVWRKTVKAADGTIESQSTYNFDTAPNGIGQLSSEAITGTYAGWVGQGGAALNYLRTYAYDTLGRAAGSTTRIDGVNYTASVQYDAFGRPWKAQDVSGRWAKSVYNNRGLIESICESNAADATMLCPANASTYVRTLETDAWGKAIRQRLGNSAAMEVTSQYWGDSGRIASICAGNATTCNLMKELYAWDAAGNLSTLQKENRTLETMNYDRLNRLTDVTLAMQGGVTVNKVAQAWVYDALGNICRKTEWGATLGYDYLGRAGCGVGGLPGSGASGTAGPHQVATIGATYLAYDARGNQTNSTRVDTPGTSRDRFIRYSLDDKGYEIALGSQANPMQRTRFWYGSDGQRYKREDGSVRTLYLGNVEIVIDGAVATFKRTLGGVMLQTITGATVSNYYLFRDQLGSLVPVTNASGTAVSSQDYNAFGVRRGYSNPDSYQDASPRQTNRGFTGQEQVDGSFVVHMNGRLYGSEIGRFLQADPVIQAPGNTQSWNAYTYVFNNPLVYTDPTGLWGKREQGYLRLAVAIVITVWTGGAAAPYFSAAAAGGAGAAAAFGTGMAIVGAGGFAAGVITTGTLKGGVIGAFSAMAFAGVGSYFNGLRDAAGALSGAEMAAKVLAHGITGGVMSVLQDGKFGHGFISAGLTAASADVIGSIGNDVVETFAAAIVGGTASELTGGKFANGAMTAAFSYAFNQVAHKQPTYDPNDPAYHRYEIEGAICRQDSVCTPESVGLASRMHPAPGTLSNTTPIVNGQRSLAQMGYGPAFDDFGPVVHSVSNDGMTIRNTTMPGHRLYPGYVERTTFARGGTVYIRTIGEGVGPMGYLNSRLANPLWNGVVNSHVRYRVNLGYGK